MVAYSDIHIDDLKNLSFKSFSEILINDFYPFLYSELNRIDEIIKSLKQDYDMDLLESVHNKVYDEFDELYRKEKLVLFPFILKLDESNSKSESCAPFKTTKQIYKSIIISLEIANEKLSNLFVTDKSSDVIFLLSEVFASFKKSMIELQSIKDKYFYKNYKSCNGCGTITGS